MTMDGISFDFGDIRITVPEHYMEELLDLAWLWGHVELAEKIELDGSSVIDINHEEFIQLCEILYGLVK